ncbi:hypothetical protein DPEC_G00280920 [Dallia pectoralis]|uniref:Uncharacterized protein n=1 Tax=Dallia pectoralis TaxID=75939 RepID=A0ACC2FMT6_DALPE|nr:hypothetical protein DPEC_G00280920 [Dallia pectoralis]
MVEVVSPHSQFPALTQSSVQYLPYLVSKLVPSSKPLWPLPGPEPPVLVPRNLSQSGFLRGSCCYPQRGGTTTLCCHRHQRCLRKNPSGHLFDMKYYLYLKPNS